MVLNFGKYRGKKLEYVINQTDGIEHLNWYIKRLNNYIENDNFKKYKEANIGYKREVEMVISKYLNNKIVNNNIESNTKEVEDNNEEVENKIEKSNKKEGNKIINPIENISKEYIENINDFKVLVSVLEELLLSKLDIKFRKPYNISKHYRDYVCLRISLKTYDEIIQEENINDIKNICLYLV